MTQHSRLLLCATVVSLLLPSWAASAAEPQGKRQARRRGDTSVAWVWQNPQTPAGTEFKTFKSTALGGQEVSYLFWAPPGYDAADAAKRYPAAYFLHGGGGNYQNIPEAFLPQAKEAIERGEIPPFLGIVVNGLPSGFYTDSADGRTPVESMIINDLLPHVDAAYPTNGVRLVEGFSMGGRGATYFGFKYPDKFRGVADFAGAIHDWAFFQKMKTVADLYADAEVFQRSWPFTLVEKNADAIRANMTPGVLIVVGDADTARGNTLAWNTKLHEALNELKIPNDFVVVNGVKHSYKLLAADPTVAKRHLEYYKAVFTADAKESAPRADAPLVPISLFDGKTLDGWVTLNGEPVTTGWVVEDGAIVRKSRGGHIVSLREYGDFDLRFEWKIAAGGNSGLKYRVAKYGKQFLGCEYQMLDDTDSRIKNAANPKTTSGALYSLYAPNDEKQLHPVGEYNEARIVVQGSRIEHWLNGKKILEVDTESDDWRERVAQSKFNDKPGFGQNRMGRIMLTDHGHAASFRNFQMIELSPSRVAEWPGAGAVMKDSDDEDREPQTTSDAASAIEEPSSE
ncbi:MAG: family 16 glycoside hydrolase [Planctomycetota bacterium]